MCVHPITVKRKLSNVGRLYKTLDWSHISELTRKGICFHSLNVTVPCGKCIECLRARQNSFALRAARVAEKYGSMQFATLTYDNWHLPFSMSSSKIDTETGEILPLTVGAIVDRDEDIYSELCRQFSMLKPGRKAIRLKQFGGCYELQFTPSLNRRDVQLWLKSARVAYEREHGFKLPKFKYMAVGEYGPNTCRPHYHIAFFGLTQKQALWLCSRWTYGYTLCKDVAAVNEDGSPGFVIASKYISKYISKGKFDCDTCKDRTAERPRICQSMKLGLLNDAELSYFRCEDVFPGLNLAYGRYDGGYLTEDDYAKLDTLVSQRSSIKVAGTVFRLPALFIRQIWSIKVVTGFKDDGKKKFALTGSPVFATLRYLARVNDLQDLPANEVSLGLPFVETSEASLSLRELREEEDYRKHLSKSIF